MININGEGEEEKERNDEKKNIYIAVTNNKNGFIKKRVTNFVTRVASNNTIKGHTSNKIEIIGIIIV